MNELAASTFASKINKSKQPIHVIGRVKRKGTWILNAVNEVTNRPFILNRVSIPELKAKVAQTDDISPRPQLTTSHGKILPKKG